jgi:hypothetical protein
MLRPLDSTTCDACTQPAVTVLEIGRAGRSDLMRAVCSEHLASTLLGATPMPGTDRVPGDKAPPGMRPG